MSEDQQTHWELLLEVDENGVGLTEDEIDFVGDLIDNDREGSLSPAEKARIRRIHGKRVNDEADDLDDL